MGNFFGKKKAASSGGKAGGSKAFGKFKQKKEELGEYISLGAAWLVGIKGDLPGLSVRMSKTDIENLIKLAESTEDNSAGFMMFPNRNQRQGKSDPYYNCVPHKDDRHVFDGGEEEEEEESEDVPL